MGGALVGVGDGVCDGGGDRNGANELLAERFEEHRGQLRAVAYRMLGSLAEAEDAVQETWLRLSRSDTGAVRNLGGWLTTVVGRICLDMLRTRTSRRESSLDADAAFDAQAALGAQAYVHVPDPVVGRVDSRGTDPEQEVLHADSVGIALLVVLETLAPAERLAFVLHDLFAVPFEEIAPIVGRNTAATRQLASRARRRVQSAPAPDTDLDRQHQVAAAFLAAARDGEFEALVAVLDPDVVLRSDQGLLQPGLVVRGASNVARGASTLGKAFAGVSRPVLVNGAPGVVTVVDGKPTRVLAFTIRDGKIAQIDILADPERVGRLGLDPVLLDG